MRSARVRSLLPSSLIPAAEVHQCAGPHTSSPERGGLAEIKPQAVGRGGEAPFQKTGCPGKAIRERAIRETPIPPSVSQVPHAISWGRGGRQSHRGASPSPVLQEVKRAPFPNLNKFIDHTTNLIPEEVLREGKQKEGHSLSFHPRPTC